VYTSGSGFYHYTYARTNWAGVYTLTVQAGVYQLSIANYRGLPAPEPITVTAPPSISTADITFPVRYTISGTVHRADGSPASGVWVTTAYTDSVYASSATDASGRYMLTVKAGAFHVTATLDKIKTAERVVTVPPAATGVDFVLPAYYRISGTVRNWDGRPMQNVTIWTAESDPLRTNAFSDGAGRYELRVPPGVYHVSPYGYDRPTPASQTVTVPPDADDVDFIFPRTYTIRGTVRDHEGFPVRNAKVSADGGTARTDNNGAYTLVVTAGRWLVHATKDDIPAQEDRRVETPPDATGVDFTMPPPPPSYTIGGTVRDQYGNPVADAQVGSMMTAADGVYTLTLPAGTHHIWANKRGYKGSGSLLVRTPPAAAQVDIILYAQDRAIYGRVVDLAGQPLAGARVGVWNALCAAWGGGSLETGADGAYRIAVAAGLYRVSAYRDGFITPQERLVDLRGAGAPAEVQVDLPLASPPYTISGQVRDRTGRPVAKAGVSATTCGLSYGASSDATGAYTISVSAGVYALSAWESSPPPPAPVQPSAISPLSAISATEMTPSASGTRPGRVSAPPGVTGADIVIGDGAAMTSSAVKGRVTDGDGWPIAGAYVSTEWTGAENGHDGRLTDTNGDFALRLWPGTYRVSVLKYGYARPEPRSVTVPPGQSGLDFVLAPAPDNVPYTVMGTVRDALGRPASFATICVQPTASSAWTWNQCQQVYHDGTFELSLESGAYRLFAAGGNGCTAPSALQQIRLPSEPGRLDFTVHALAQLVSGVIVDSLGRPVCAARVGVRDGPAQLSTVTNEQGYYALPLPTGAFTLTAIRDGYGTASDVQVEIPLAVPNVDFVLPLPPNTIQGVVRDPCGAAVAGAAVEVSGPVQMEPTATDASGAYALYVPSGDWQVTANRPGYTGFPPRKSAVVPPSPAQLDFLLAPNNDVRLRYLPLLLQMPALR
jgi:protocatechuate 3,4-dioxygenase beta subunit